MESYLKNRLDNYLKNRILKPEAIESREPMEFTINSLAAMYRALEETTRANSSLTTVFVFNAAVIIGNYSDPWVYMIPLLITIPAKWWYWRKYNKLRIEFSTLIVQILITDKAMYNRLYLALALIIDRTESQEAKKLIEAVISKCEERITQKEKE